MTTIKTNVPDNPSIPFVFSSPHSGDDYKRFSFGDLGVGFNLLQRSEDKYVNELFAGVANRSISYIEALFPRSYCDPNRETYELDPDMFSHPLPDFVNVSKRAKRGLGTIARITLDGSLIHKNKLTFEEANNRIQTCWVPYHTTLNGMLQHTLAQFGKVYLVDCHSMPSMGGTEDLDAGKYRPDVILGNRHETTCSGELIDFFDKELSKMGLHVIRNKIFAGGYITQHYGKPEQNIHSLQIEFNRDLYMNEVSLERKPKLATLTNNINVMLDELMKAFSKI